MPGFFISNMGTEIELVTPYEETCIKEELTGNQFVVKRNTLVKFLNDKVFIQNDNYIFICEGVLLNKTELLTEYQASDMASLIFEMRTREGEMFFSKFRGSFSGALYEKNTDEWLIWTNHFGDNAVFYYQSNGKYDIGSQVNYLLDSLKLSGISITFDEMSAYHMLTYGFMGDNRTYANEVKRLLPGHYIKIAGSTFSVKKYWEAKHNAIDVSGMGYEDIIERVDELFRKAITREYEKDCEYGYKHIAELSGGLDSRMSAWVANSLGYSDILTVTFSQSNYLDEIIAKEIAAELKTEHMIRTLDDATFLFDIDTIIKMNYGLALYSSISCSKRLFEALNMKRYGLIHTGQIGDVILGSFVKSEKELKDSSLDGLYSRRLIGRIENACSPHHYSNKELYLLNVRGLLGATTSHLVLRNFTEVSSPFLDLDFFEFCYSIPISYRLKHRIYKDWIRKKYPRAAEFIWEKEGVPVTASSTRALIHKIIKKWPDGVRMILGVPIDFQAKGKTMNPLSFWWKTNEALREFMQEYFDNNFDNPQFSPELKEDIKQLFDQGTVLEKTQALTVLSATRYYF